MGIVYTCQRQGTQPGQGHGQGQRRCNFFLWASDAGIREKMVVLSNSRSETSSSFSSSSFDSVSSFPGRMLTGSMTTPTKCAGNANGNASGLLTPQTERKIRDCHRPVGSLSATSTPAKGAKARMMEEDVDGHDDHDENDDGDGIEGKTMSFLDRLRGVTGLGQDSPRKTPRTTTVSSPEKRKRVSDMDIQDEDDSDSLHTQQTQPLQRDPFLSSPPPSQTLSHSYSSSSSPWTRHPSYPSLPPSSAEICQSPIPTKYPRTSILSTTTDLFNNSPSQQQQQQQQQTSNLAGEAISLLEGQGVVIPRSTQEELVALLGRHENRVKGVVRGRDITRAALKRKEEEVERLERRVGELEDMLA